MALTRRRKLAIISLAIFWPTLFVLSHIPIPKQVQQADVLDKGLHVLAYMTLVFLVWISLNPEDRVRWRKATVWCVLLTIAVYGVIDEVLQQYVGRSCDRMDWVADMAGALTGCLVLTFFSFWPAAAICGAVLICGLTNIARERLADVAPVANAVFHLFSYAIFTLTWIRCMRRFQTLRVPRPKLKWLLTALTPPMLLLVVVKGYSIWLGREFPIQDVILSVGGIVTVVGVVWAMFLYRKSTAQGTPDSDG